MNQELYNVLFYGTTLIICMGLLFVGTDTDDKTLKRASIVSGSLGILMIVSRAFMGAEYICLGLYIITGICSTITLCLIMMRHCKDNHLMSVIAAMAYMLCLLIFIIGGFTLLDEARGVTYERVDGVVEEVNYDILIGHY